MKTISALPVATLLFVSASCMAATVTYKTPDLTIVAIMKKFIALFCTGLLLALIGCGGGGGGSNGGGGAEPSPLLSPAGIWFANGQTDWNFEAIVLDTGEYFFIYTDKATGNGSLTGGLVQGSATLSGDHFSSSNGLDFNFEGVGVSPRSLEATVTTYPLLQDTTALNGTVTADSSSSQNFTSISDPLYYLTPTLETVAGTYDGHLDSAAEPEFFRLSISNAGDIAATGSSGCVATGTIKPHSSGNVYDIQITFGSSPCGQPNKQVSGVGVSYSDPGLPGLILGLVDSGRTFGVVFWGAKEEELDFDGDGVVDGQDTDDDNDGVVDVDDTCPLDASPYCPVAITATKFLNGREWAQVDAFAHVSYQQVVAACPAGVCTGVLNGYAMDGWTWAAMDDVCAIFDSYAGLDVCDFDGYIDEEVVHDFFADGWLLNGTPYDQMGSVQTLSGYVRPGVYGIGDVFFTYPICDAFSVNGWEMDWGMGCHNTGIVPPVRGESGTGAWFFRPL